ncbi:MAG TPA: outer membrane protein assembly factor BamE [Usitatibacter sp.]|nr:outer membrane protein assembly factor BamE [Usitatibacter sp.]
MKRIPALILAGAALSLSAASFAAPKIAFYRDGPVKAITAGQTEDDVRSVMGSPYSTRNVAGETHYYYRVEDNFGTPAWLDVAFDPGGYVIRKGELRMID